MEEEDYNELSGDLPKKLLQGFSIPKIKKPEINILGEREPEKEEDENPTVLEDSNSWSSSAKQLEKSSINSRKRSFQEVAITRSWANEYDKPIPEDLLKLCLENECKICGVQITTFLIRQQHYTGAKHEKRVKIELEEIYKQNDEESMPKKKKVEKNVFNPDDFLRRMESQVNRTSSHISKEPTLGEFKLSKWFEDWSKSWDLPIPSEIISMCSSTKCSICEISFKGVLEAKSHFGGKKHGDKFKACLDAFCQQKGITAPQKIGEGTRLKEDFCKICKVELSSSTMARIHFDGKRHINNMKSVSVQGEDKEYSVPSDDLKSVLEEAVVEDGMDGTWGETPTDCKLKICQEIDSKPSLIEPSLKYNEENEFFCNICNIRLSSQVTYNDHINGKSHKKKVNCGNQTNGFFCQLCGITMTGQQTYDAHISGKLHAKKLAAKVSQEKTFPDFENNLVITSQDLSEDMKTEAPDNTMNITLTPNQLHCKVCDLILNSQITYDVHISGKNHKKRLNSTINASDTYFCHLCRIELNGKSCYEAHLSGKPHAKKLAAQNACNLSS